MTGPAADAEFRQEMVELESAYLLGADPIERSGFGGGVARWESERRPLTDAINRPGSFLDVGCAHGWLAACVVVWCRERSITIEPFGIDLGAELVAEAKAHHPGHPDNFWSGDAWTWQPVRIFTYVYSLLDLAPDDMVETWLDRLASWVEPGGRLIIGSYGSRSRNTEPDDVPASLRKAGYEVAGSSSGDGDPIVCFAWAQL